MWAHFSVPERFAQGGSFLLSLQAGEGFPKWERNGALQREEHF